MEQINGVISILKPPGMTSHDVVSFLRKKTGIKKIGHTGTLDPGAAGVLPVCIGKATKIVDYIMAENKTYICEITLGNRTDTYDKYGKFLFDENKDCSDITLELFIEVLKQFTGVISQAPPAYSAIKIDGERAYDLARRGVEFEIKSRSISIYSIEIKKFSPPFVMVEVNCSKGTYIRSLCNDIGDALGCGAYMSFLLRTQTGNFNIDNSYILEDITSLEDVQKYIYKIDEVLKMESVYIEECYTSKILNGNQLVLNDYYSEETKLVKVYLKPDNFVAIGKINGRMLSIEKLLV